MLEVERGRGRGAWVERGGPGLGGGAKDKRGGTRGRGGVTGGADKQQVQARPGGGQG